MQIRNSTWDGQVSQITAENEVSLKCVVVQTTRRKVEIEPVGEVESLHPDMLLLAQVQDRDENAMGRLYDSYSRIVYVVALRVLRDPSEAEDVLQEVFLRIWRKPSSFVAARGSLASWLAVIARNRAIDVVRQRRPMESVEDLPIASTGNVSTEVEHIVMMARIKPLIANLPSVQRRVLELAFLQGCTHAEIAESTNIPLGTIKTRIRSALQTLSKEFHACQQVAKITYGQSA